MSAPQNRRLYQLHDCNEDQRVEQKGLRCVIISCCHLDKNVATLLIYLHSVQTLHPSFAKIKVKTSVQKKNPNHVWNEVLQLSVTNPTKPVKLVSSC
ncbi:hypothetical protein GUJ93_ZPchr0006g40974 [Zizania palustris]|uniref:C2 domain-containing protein n=1 Tax=Zizania palustris TaxID=103762 RepID=A0A8J5TB70_ZIZPA|nr:hypothetical protein GUJ93_ZPchr0006g40974 [Zizania palustris]